MKPAAKTTETTPAFELKGSTQTLMVLYLWDADSDLLTRQLMEKLAQMPGFFKNVPLVIELGGLQDTEQLPDFPQLVQTLRGLGLVPAGVRGGSAAQNELALAANLGILAAPRTDRTASPALDEIAEPPLAEEPQPTLLPAFDSSAKIITQPIRSGQRVVAPHGDLIVLAAVNAGAEILAAGNIHVYGALRGRALAGVKGNTEARIVCLQFYPELVAIAGEYMVNDELDQTQFGQSTVVALADNQLSIETIGSFVPLS